MRIRMQPVNKTEPSCVTYKKNKNKKWISNKQIMRKKVNMLLEYKMSVPEVV